MQGMLFVVQGYSTACSRPAWHQTVTALADMHDAVACTGVITQQQDMSSATLSKAQHLWPSRLLACQLCFVSSEQASDKLTATQITLSTTSIHAFTH